MAKHQSTILCATGEHYVAAYLSGMGLVAALPRGGVPATDLIVTSERGGRSVSLQVKAGGIYSHRIYKRKPENNAWVWRTGPGAKNRSSESHWYAFVYVGDWPSGGGLPEVFFVPSEVVAVKAHDPEIVEGWFWISEAEAEQYRGREGFKKLKMAVDG
jgi:hypothetical protein